jgi:hypothetical protein
LLERRQLTGAAVLGEYITPDFSLQLLHRYAACFVGNHRAMHNNIIIHAIKGDARISSFFGARLDIDLAVYIEGVEGDFLSPVVLPSFLCGELESFQ